MTPEEYIESVLKTESSDFELIAQRLNDPKTLRFLHATIGMVTEAAELIDGLKKYIFYGKPIDTINLKEEIGDNQWYTAIALHNLGSSYEEIWLMNIAKLAKRYGIRFTEDGAVTRDLSAERYILEVKDKEGKDESTNKNS
jgi:NTP pyrophosphatase (non-canonical NTP hydrolase)